MSRKYKFRDQEKPYFVSEPEHWRKYSSAIDYAGEKKGLLDICYIE